MLIRYIQVAMHQATYEFLSEEDEYYGEIPGFQGVWATAPTLETCREELQDVLEGWIILGLRLKHPFPVIDNIDLNVPQEVA